MFSLPCQDCQGERTSLHSKLELLMFQHCVSLCAVFLRVNIKSVNKSQGNLISYQLLIPLHAIYNQYSIVKVSSYGVIFTC